MIKRIAALAFIFVCTSIAWAILGSTILARTYSPLSGELRSRVAASWGTAQVQTPPTASYQHEVTRTVEGEKGPKQIKITETDSLKVDAHKSLRRPGNRHGQLFQLHYIRTAVGMDADRFHHRGSTYLNSFKKFN